MVFWDIHDAGIIIDYSIPVAIPSFNREVKLVEQSLATLSFYGWNMKKVFIFLDETHTRVNGTSEKTAYRKHLRASGYGEVTLLPGGACLMTQYHKISSFFSGQKVIILSDTVPGIVWRRHQTHLTTEPLPSALLYRVVSVMFCVIAEKMWNIWSLGPCKAARNLQPGHISQKCGLLDGNFFGIDLKFKDAPTLCISNFTTDVELTLRMWTRDGGFARMLGVSALHQYRQTGGHCANNKAVHKRMVATDKAIRRLGNLYPGLLTFVPLKRISEAGMKYRFLPKGAAPLLLAGTYTKRGRPCENGCRAKSVADRVRKHRKLKKVIVAMKMQTKYTYASLTLGCC